MDGLEANVNERGGSEHGPCLHQPCSQCPCAWMLIGLQRECRKQVYTWGRRDCQSAGGQDKNRWEGAGSDWWRCQDKNRWERLEVIVGGARTRTGERGWKWLVPGQEQGERLEVIVGGARTRTGERGWKWLVPGQEQGERGWKWLLEMPRQEQVRGAGSDCWRCQDKNRWEGLEVIGGGLGICCPVSSRNTGLWTASQSRRTFRLACPLCLPCAGCCHRSCVQLFATPWTVARQVPLCP